MGTGKVVFNTVRNDDLYRKFCDEQTVLFPAGNQIARFNMEQKHMRFIGGSENAQNITAMAISPNNRFFFFENYFVRIRARY